MSPEGERAVGLLKLANYARVAEVLGVSRASVARWAKGQQVTPWQLQRLQELLGHQETAAPSWAAAMEERLAEKIDRNRQFIERLIPDEALRNADVLIERLEELLRLRGEDALEGTDEPGPGEGGPQVQANGLPPDRAAGQ